MAIEVGEPRPGRTAISRRLVDILFVQLVRHWLDREPHAQQGWLFALGDDRVRLALSRIHEDPARDWTVASLAREAAMSRAAFAKRFSHLVGQGPMTYVTAWRMHLAARLLRDSDLGVAEVSARVGYQSEFAFSRAFRRVWLTPRPTIGSRPRSA